MEPDIKQIGVGLGITILFFCLKYLAHILNKYIAWAGMLLGIIIVIASFLPTHSSLSKEHLPGFSSTFGLKIKYAATLGKQRVLGYGDPEGAKVEFYLSASGRRLIFSVTDIHGDVQTMDLGIGTGGIPINRFVFLTCQVGLDSNETYLRMWINENEVQSRTLPFQMDLGSRQWAHETIGDDLQGQNDAAFDLLDKLAIGNSTLNNQEIGRLFKGLRTHLQDMDSPLANDLDQGP
jgi:hypothetical protein